MGSRSARLFLSVVCLILVLAMVGLSLPASAQEATFVIIDVPDSIGTFAKSINPAGAITGSYFGMHGGYIGMHGFLRTPDGAFTTIDPPDASLTEPTSMNPAWAITGIYDGSGDGFLRAPDGTFTTIDGFSPTWINIAGAITGGNGTYGFLRSPDGTVATFTVPGSTSTAPASINDEGAITGSYSDSSNVGHGFLRAPDGTFTSFDPPGAISITPLPHGAYYTTPVGINPAGAIAGYYSDNSLATHGFLRSPGGTFTIIDAPGSAGYTEALGINPAGMIIGIRNDVKPYVQHGFLRSPDGTFTTVDPPYPPFAVGVPTSINPAGAITGIVDGPGTTASFLRIPPPDATGTTLTSSLNPSIYGETATLTATVKSAGPTIPTGKVRFTWQYYTETYTVGSATLNSSGVATLAKSKLNADLYPLVAVYGGDANHLSSKSAVLNQSIIQTTSAAAISSSENPSTHGQAVTFTATITSPTVIPSGPVTFSAGKTVLGTAELSAGKARFTTTALSTGSITVTATYYGDSNIAMSSASVIQNVK